MTGALLDESWLVSYVVVGESSLSRSSSFRNVYVGGEAREGRSPLIYKSSTIRARFNYPATILGYHLDQRFGIAQVVIRIKVKLSYIDY